MTDEVGWRPGLSAGLAFSPVAKVCAASPSRHRGHSQVGVLPGSSAPHCGHVRSTEVVFISPYNPISNSGQRLQGSCPCVAPRGSISTTATRVAGHPERGVYAASKHFLTEASVSKGARIWYWTSKRRKRCKHNAPSLESVVVALATECCKQLPDLFFDFGRRGDRLGDLFAQMILIAASQPVDRYFHSAFLHLQGRASLSLRDRRAVA